jgi:hypothetical protein
VGFFEGGALGPLPRVGQDLSLITTEEEDFKADFDHVDICKKVQEGVRI